MGQFVTFPASPLTLTLTKTSLVKTKLPARKREESGEQHLIKSDVMQTYLKALQGQLRVDFDNSNRVGKFRECWLRMHLEENNWWIRKEHVEAICKHLNLPAKDSGLPAYYRSVKADVNS